ncbi:MAG: hypothetical protein HQK62_08275, partial [Desulfamplus sp.]|nr:hypothetical protein [Desulfamplus sp.]
MNKRTWPDLATTNNENEILHFHGKVLITTSSFGLHDTAPLDRLKDSGFEVVMNPYNRKLTEKEVSSLLETHAPVGIIAGVEPLTASVLQKTSGLKVISRCGIGLDSVDTQSAEQMGIVVTNTPDAPTIPVAELTLGLILSLLRKIHRSDSAIRNGQWHRPMGNLLFGKTVGIIGCGRIGSYVAQLLAPFKCRILGYDAYSHDNTYLHSDSNFSGSSLLSCHKPSSFQASSSQPSCCHSFPYQPSNLNILLAESDIITLHIPYSTENH